MLIWKKRKIQTLNVYHNRRHKVLVLRQVGGLGDIFMHRMMFEDFKLQMPNCHLTFACPPQYIEAVKDHPFLDNIVDCRTVNMQDYGVVYNTSSACGTYELCIAPRADLHRSDIWANHCGLALNHHNMHINLSPNIVKFGKQLLKQIQPSSAKPKVVLCPVSAMKCKDLLIDQIDGVNKWLQSKDIEVIGLHSKPVEALVKLNIKNVCGLSIQQWMGVLNAADYVISVDTASFHYAGGINKPVVGIFTFCDGKVYSKYYPTSQLVQKHRDDGNWPCGPCYTVSSCPKCSDPVKPCLSELTSKDIINGLEKLFIRFPWFEKK